MNSVDDIDAQLKKEEQDYLDSLNPLEKLFDNHWTFIAVFIFMCSFGMVFGLVIGMML